MKKLRHYWHVIRHGEWDCGIERDRSNWKFGYFKVYYDGDWRALWLGCFWVCNYY
jgi:hypothetical protein